MKSIGRSLRITPKKINLIADLVRRKDADRAISLLKFTPKKGAGILRKIIGSAVANAVNNFKQERASLYVKEIIVTEGSVLKRGISVSRGRVHPIKKRMSHVTVLLGVREETVTTTEAGKPGKEAASDAKTPAKKTTKPAATANKAATPKKKTVVKA